MLTATLTSLHRIVTDRISFHILLVAFGALFIALAILGKISLNVTKPIVALAKATESISSGKYEEINLPDVGNRKDEIAILTRSFKEMVDGLRDREKIRGVLNKVVSKDVADEILKTNIHLGGEDRVVTILFSDIRGFTKLSENLHPQKIISLLNTFMTKMSRVIEGEGGVIDKYVGDEIMALYGAPTSHPDHAIRALASAMLMMETLKGWNKERVAQGLPPIEMGIGIHTGLVVAGNMGAEDRLNYTVIGANVNLASRLCTVAQAMQIVISSSTYLAPNVKDSFVAKPLDPLKLKGISEPIDAYELIGFQWDTA
jgi:adenylate cyclase